MPSPGRAVVAHLCRSSPGRRRAELPRLPKHAVRQAASPSGRRERTSAGAPPARHPCNTTMQHSRPSRATAAFSRDTPRSEVGARAARRRPSFAYRTITPLASLVCGASSCLSGRRRCRILRLYSFDAMLAAARAGLLRRRLPLAARPRRKSGNFASELYDGNGESRRARAALVF